MVSGYLVLEETRDEGFGVQGRQINPDAMAAAGGDGNRFAGCVLHAADALHVVAGRMQAFHGIAQRRSGS